MVTSDGFVRPLPIIAGNLALDFANTVDDPDGPARYDHIATYTGLVDWASRVGVLDRPQADALGDVEPHVQRSAVANAHLLRDALNDLFGAIADGARDASDRWHGLRPFVAEAMTAAELDGRPGVHRWLWPRDGDPAVILHPVATVAAALLMNDDVRLVKRCGRCPWLFIDRSKNHRRRWCDMNDCGKAVKMERYVRRRAARRAAERGA